MFIHKPEISTLPDRFLLSHLVYYLQVDKVEHHFRRLENSTYNEKTDDNMERLDTVRLFSLLWLVPYSTFR